MTHAPARGLVGPRTARRRPSPRDVFHPARSPSRGAAEPPLKREQCEARLLARVDESAAETRRYMGVVAEDLRSDIKAVAEGLGALDEKVERFRREEIRR